MQGNMHVCRQAATWLARVYLIEKSKDNSRSVRVRIADSVQTLRGLGVFWICDHQTTTGSEAHPATTLGF